MMNVDHTLLNTPDVRCILLKGFTVCKKEALAVDFVLKEFRNYLLSSKTFTFITDHQPLCSAFKNRDVQRHLVRRLDLLAGYRYEILYCSGMSKMPADNFPRQYYKYLQDPKTLQPVDHNHNQLCEEELIPIFHILKHISKSSPQRL